MSHGYKFYIQRVEKVGNEYLPIESSTMGLESHYSGLKYSKLTGINDIGKTKNIYTEKYADGDRLRVYIPELAQHEATTMTLTLYFFGKNRQSVYEDFANEIKTGVHRYWDTARQHFFDFYVDDEIKPSDENWYKGEPYFKVDVKMKNLYGQCFNRASTNLLTDGNNVINNNSYHLGSYHLGPIKPLDGELVELSFSGYISKDNESTTPPIKGYDFLNIYNSGWNVPLIKVYDKDYNKDQKRYIVTFNWKIGDSDNNSLYFFQGDGNSMSVPEGYIKGSSTVYDVKLEIAKIKTI